MSRPRNSPTISTVSTSLSASTGVGPRWRGLRSWQRSRTKSSTRQNTATIRVSRSMAVPRFDSAVARNGPAPPGYPQPPSCSKTRTPGQLGELHHNTLEVEGGQTLDVSSTLLRQPPEPGAPLEVRSAAEDAS